jgi:hypothetical protein
MILIIFQASTFYFILWFQEFWQFVFHFWEFIFLNEKKSPNFVLATIQKFKLNN